VQVRITMQCRDVIAAAMLALPGICKTQTASSSQPVGKRAPSYLTDLFHLDR
jgi:hypothetical protein